jgi:4'-phosphopantetheinyl transferase
VTVVLRACRPPPRVASEDLQVLSTDERRRAASIRHPAARTRFVTGRALLRRLVARVQGTLAADIRLAAEPWGRPWLPDHPGLAISCSGTRGLVVAGVATAVSGLGVDVERTDRWPLPPDERWCSARELAWLDHCPDEDTKRVSAIVLWTGKEATAKARGVGLRSPLRSLEVDPGGVPVRLLGTRQARTGHVIAVAVAPPDVAATVAWHAAGAAGHKAPITVTTLG